MPDGGVVSQQSFHRLKATAGQRFRAGNIAGCAKSIRAMIPSDEWDTIIRWMKLQTRKRLDENIQDHFTVVLMGHAGARTKKNVTEIFERIISTGTLGGNILR